MFSLPAERRTIFLMEKLRKTSSSQNADQQSTVHQSKLFITENIGVGVLDADVWGKYMKKGRIKLWKC
jgi:hypothetical protein